MTSVAVQVLEQWLTEDFAGVLQFCYGNDLVHETYNFASFPLPLPLVLLPSHANLASRRSVSAAVWTRLARRLRSSRWDAERQ